MPEEILSIASEPAVLARQGKIVFANAEAQSILGSDCVNKPVAVIFGPEIAESQASAFIACVPIAGEQSIARVAKISQGLVIFFSRAEDVPAILTEPLLNVLRNGLMNVNMACDLVREQAERSHDELILLPLAVLSRNYYKLVRVCSNASIATTKYGSDLQHSAGTIDLSQLCRGIIDSMKKLALTIQFSLECEDEVFITASSFIIRQLILNLISNCILHATGCTKICIRIADLGESVLLSVCDDGCGISAEELHTVFDRYKYGLSLSSMDKGTGFGLTVVRRIAQLQGGSLVLESRPGHGTTVRVSMCKLPPTLNLSTSPVGYHSEDSALLMGLSDILPVEFYRNKYMD